MRQYGDMFNTYTGIPCETRTVMLDYSKWRALYMGCNDRLKQDMLNNLFSNNPGELDRWADDGGPVNDR